MKYIEFPELSRLAQALSHEGPECSVHTRIEAYSCKPISRDKKLFKSLETAYIDDTAASPPLPAFVEPEAELATPFGPIDKHASRKTLYTLIATLNVAFPDHEFSDVRPGHFTKEPSGAAVLNSLSTTLISPGGNGSPAYGAYGAYGRGRAPARAPRTYSAYPPSSPDLFPSSAPTSSSPVSLMRPSPFAPPKVVTSTHPTLFRILDDVIGLTDCEVFSYTPDIASDPHANDDDEDFDAASVGDEDSEDENPDEFPFDADFDEEPSYTSTSPGRRIYTASPTRDGTHNHSSGSLNSPPVRHQRPHRTRGALLWSSHWFFFNRKLKRIIYITLWSRTSRPRWRTDSGSSNESNDWSNDLVSSSSSSSVPKERFHAWSDSTGAGARAMGLHAWM
jgi:hypothetical protein